MVRRSGRAAVSAALALALSVAGAARAGTPPLSRAQVLLFETPHLSNVRRPETLDYEFRRAGAGVADFTDRIAMHVVEIHPDGTKDVTLDFLSGDRRRPFPGVANFSGNPLLMAFLENDVREMHDAVGLAAAWFRNRVRQAFVDKATTRDISLHVGGREMPATEILLAPYADEPRLGNLPQVQHKAYRFVLAPSLPGMIYELSSRYPGAGAMPAQSETITYTGEGS